MNPTNNNPITPNRPETLEAYTPPSDSFAEVMNAFILGRTNSQRQYNQFNNRTLYQAIDDWTMRWNGYIPQPSVLLDADQSHIFLNFTRNQIVSYLAKVSISSPKSKIKAINKKSGSVDQKFSDVLDDLNTFSLNEENGDARFLDIGLETTIKGTGIVYEGYKKLTQKGDFPTEVDTESGEVETEREERVIFDNCYQEIVPVEDFYIANPYQPDVQKQPFVIWRKVTTYQEASAEFGKYNNWKYVTPGSYVLNGDVTTFYRTRIASDLSQNQVEIVRYYNRKENKFILMISGVILYEGVIPFKDGRYPFAKYIFEPFDTFFFWGSSYPNKIMGEQDLMNTFINMMADKTFGSLLPYGLSSDLDDIIEDDVLQVNKIRKVGDINKWKFDTLPGVSAGEQGMFQTVLSLARENSGDITGGATASTVHGGKVTARQALMKQQETMERLGFSAGFLEDGDRDRTILRIDHILQFYSIPKIEKITGKSEQDLQQITYRDIHLDNVPLDNGKKGTKLIKLHDGFVTPDDKRKFADDLSVEEEKGEAQGTPTQALGLNINTFQDYNLSVQVIKNSSFENNKVLDQAMRMDYANWRISMMQVGAPIDVPSLVSWVSETFDVDEDEFAPKQSPMQNPMQNPLAQAMAGAGGTPMAGGGQAPQNAPHMQGSPIKMSLDDMM